MALVLLLLFGLVACSQEPRLDASSAEAFKQSHARLTASLPEDERERLRLMEVVFLAHCADPADVERAIGEQDHVRLLATAPCRGTMHGMTYKDILHRLDQRPEGRPLIPLLVAMFCSVAFARAVKPPQTLAARQGCPAAGAGDRAFQHHDRHGSERASG
jgi:hypothetical protein